MRVSGVHSFSWQEYPVSSPQWTSRGKTVASLIKELQSFENQDIEVRISIDAR
jgi:hypothetical protein